MAKRLYRLGPSKYFLLRQLDFLDFAELFLGDFQSGLRYVVYENLVDLEPLVWSHIDQLAIAVVWCPKLEVA